MSSRREVFFSYAREDQARVAEVYRLLNSKGFQPWMDSRDIMAGEDWELSIKRAIRRANYFLVFLSSHSIAKAGVLQDEIRSGVEIRQANLEGERFLIPVRLEPCAVPDTLKSLQWVDYFGSDGPSRLLGALGYRPRRGWLIGALTALAPILCLLAFWIHQSEKRAYAQLLQSRQPAEARPADSSEALVGITLWELRPTRETDPLPVREIFHPPSPTAGGEMKLTPVRSRTKLSLDRADKFRVAVESSRPGYLYVIDREQYGAHGLGDPLLVFPTTRIRDGNNHITGGGSLIELPADYWELRSQHHDYRGEQITIVLTPQPMEFAIGPDPLRLDKALLLKWENQWRAPARLVVDQTASTETTVTPAEVKSRNSTGHRLTAQDPRPQYLYSLAATPNAPFLFDFSISVLNYRP